ETLALARDDERIDARRRRERRGLVEDRQRARDVRLRLEARQIEQIRRLAARVRGGIGEQAPQPQQRIAVPLGERDPFAAEQRRALPRIEGDRTLIRVARAGGIPAAVLEDLALLDVEIGALRLRARESDLRIDQFL